MKQLSFFCLLLAFSSLLGQKAKTPICNYTGNRSPQFGEITETSEGAVEIENLAQINSQVEGAVAQVISLMGLSKNIKVEAGGVENAAAMIKEGKRIIVYSPAFMREAYNINYWAVMSIIAHEVGHHLEGHSLEEEDSECKNNELQADKFSGSILFKLGATLQQAQSAVEKLTLDNENSLTHPPKEERLIAIRKGWLEAKVQKEGTEEEVSSTKFNENTANSFQLMEEGKNAYDRKDYNKAFLLLSKCQNSTYFDVGAQFRLGYMYDVGKGTSANPLEAAKWYKKASNKGNAQAQCNLGCLYENGRGVAKDPYEAVEWYSLAAKNGNAQAQNNLGTCYREGEGVTKNEKLAMECYAKAAQQGNLAAQNNLGTCYRDGQGIKVNEYEAIRWYRKAADQGYSYAQKNLAIMYEKGRGVEKNIPEAIRLYRLAAQQENDYAKKALVRLGVSVN